MSHPAGALLAFALPFLALLSGCAPTDEAATAAAATDQHPSRVVTRGELGDRWPFVAGIDEVTLSADCSTGATYLRVDTGPKEPSDPAFMDRVAIFSLNGAAQRASGYPYPNQSHPSLWSVDRDTVQADGSFRTEHGVSHVLPALDRWYDAAGKERVLPDQGAVAEHVRPGDRMERCAYAGALSSLAMDLCQ